MSESVYAAISSEDPASEIEVKIYRTQFIFWICFEVTGAAFTKDDKIQEIYSKFHGICLENTSKYQQSKYFLEMLGVETCGFFGIRFSRDKIICQPLHRNDEISMIILVKNTIKKMYPSNKISFNEEKFKRF